jgi:DNA repair exonuclease SbcCD ATPase subunit
LEIALPAGLIGMVGLNGYGKTNVANAIRGALTGVFKRHTGDTAAGCIRQGQDNNARVEIYGTLAGVPFTLHREISPKIIKHKLYVAGEVFSEKANEIEAWLTEASGLTPALMSEFMFIGQHDLYSFLDATDTERSKKFTALCGTKVYEKLRDEYTDMLKVDKAKCAAINETIMETLEQQIIVQEEKVTSLNKRSAELESKLLSLGGDKYQERLEQNQELLRHTEKLSSLVDQIDKDQDRGNKLAADIKHNQTKTLAITAELAENAKEALHLHSGFDTPDEALETYNAAIQKNTELARLQKALENAKGVQKEAKETLELSEKHFNKFKEERGYKDIQSMDDAMGVCQQSLENHQNGRTIMAERKDLFQYLKQTFDRNEQHEQCPLCQADKKHWNTSSVDLAEQTEKMTKEIERHDKKVEKAKKELDGLKQTRQAFQNWLETISVYMRDNTIFAGQTSSAQEELNGFAEEYTPIDNAQELYTELRAHQKRQKDLQHQLATAQTQMEQAENLQKSLEENILDLKKQMTDIPRPILDLLKTPGFPTMAWFKLNIPHFRRKIEEKIETCKEKLEAVQESKSAWVSLLGQSKEATNHLVELQKRLDEAKSQLAENGNAQQWFDYCERALAWLRKDGLPKLVHASVLKQLCSVVNEELSFFDDPFKVEVGEDLSFVAYFEDERVISSKALSGGEKVMLALSFWSAVSRVFAKNLGIMILDEPTDGLDADNNERLYQIMLRWRQLLHQRGQQVLIISHDEGMKDVFDHVIQL